MYGAGANKKASTHADLSPLHELWGDACQRVDNRKRRRELTRPGFIMFNNADPPRKKTVNAGNMAQAGAKRNQRVESMTEPRRT